MCVGCCICLFFFVSCLLIFDHLCVPCHQHCGINVSVRVKPFRVKQLVRNSFQLLSRLLKRFGIVFICGNILLVMAAQQRYYICTSL